MLATKTPSLVHTVLHQWFANEPWSSFLLDPTDLSLLTKNLMSELSDVGGQASSVLHVASQRRSFYGSVSTPGPRRLSAGTAWYKVVFLEVVMHIR